MKKILIITLCILLFAPQAMASFDDVSENDDYYYAVEYLEASGAISSNTSFYPDEPVTKAAFFKMLLANAGVDTDDVKNNYFEDLTGEEWFAPYANKAVELGLIEVKSSYPYFDGDKNINKTEAAKILLKWGDITTPLFISEDEWNLDFKDIGYDNKYAPYVEKVIELGILEPYNEYYFGTYRKLTRGDAALAIYNLESYTLTDAYMQIIADEIRADFDVPLILILEDVYTRLTNEYYEGDVDGELIMYEAIKSMTESAGDPHTIFMDPGETESFYGSLSGDFKGIGIYVEKNDDGTITITNVIEGSPAEEAGLLANDIILEVDGTDITEMELSDVISLITGEEGTEVELKIRRSSAMESRTLFVTAVRGSFEISYISTEILEDNILYYELLSFGETTGTEFTALTNAALDEGIFEGIILDMRDNGGGYVYTAIEILNNFIPENDTLLVISYTDSNIIYISEGPGTLSEYPIVVLINENSASASEITASCLQDYGYAEIMGTTSYGKGSAQDVYEYYEGSSLKITTSHWLTPNWMDLNGIGVNPDTEVVDDENTNNDEQLEAAIEKLKEMIEQN